MRGSIVPTNSTKAAAVVPLADPFHQRGIRIEEGIRHPGVNHGNPLRGNPQDLDGIVARMGRDRDQPVGGACQIDEAAIRPHVRPRMQFRHQKTGQVVDRSRQPAAAGRPPDQVGRMENVGPPCHPIEYRKRRIVRQRQRRQPGRGAPPARHRRIVIQIAQPVERRKGANRILPRSAPQVGDPIIEIVLHPRAADQQRHGIDYHPRSLRLSTQLPIVPSPCERPQPARAGAK